MARAFVTFHRSLNEYIRPVDGMRRLAARTGALAVRASCVTALALAASSPALAQTSPAGRLLASNCFQCHGTNGKGPGFERLAGSSASSIYNDLKKYQSRTTEIMGVHAKGYTDAQLQALANWLSTQR
jgi:cytochrome c553